MSILSADQRRAILDGIPVRLAFDPRGLVPLDVGQEIELTSRVSIRIDKRHRGRKGEIVFDYTVRDNRDYYLRRVPPATSYETDEHGNPEPPTTEAIVRAAVESSYDGNVRDPVDAGIAVPPKFQNVLRLQGIVRHSEHRRRTAAEQRAKETSRQLAKTVSEIATGMARKGLDTTEFFAELQRVAIEKRDHLRDAA